MIRRLFTKEVLFRAILLLVSSSLALAAVEVFLRIDDRRPPLELTEVELNGQTYHFHDVEEAFGDYENSVVFIGDSFTAGWNCSTGSTFPSRSGELLRPVQHAVNLGVPGFDVFDYLRVGRDLLADASPRHVVVTLYLNDMEPGCQMCRYLNDLDDPAAAELARAVCESCGFADESAEAVQDGMPRRPQSIFRRVHTAISGRSVAYSVMKDAVAVALIRGGLDLEWGQTAYPTWWDDTDGGHFQLLVAALTRLEGELAAAGVGMTVLIYPDPTAMTEQNQWVPILDRAAAALSGDLGVTVKSGYDAFLDNPAAGTDMYHSIADRHPDCEAHRLFGEWAYEVVSEDLRTLSDG